VKPKRLKNSTGGAEPESNSPIAGDSKNRIKAGGGFEIFMFFGIILLEYYVLYVTILILVSYLQCTSLF
jgi:hypothetical protein